MGKLEYHDITKTETDARKEISDNVENVTDVVHLGPWTKDSKDRYTYNNTESDKLPPLIINIRDDSVVTLLTTAYGSPTVSKGQCQLAKKRFSVEDSALEWFKQEFDTEE